MTGRQQKIHPEYSEAYRLATEFWENPIVQKNWRNPLILIKKMGWELIPYNYKKIKELSKEAYSTYKENKFFILYNMNNHFGRITFSLHHETGHIVGGHPIRCGEVLYKSCKNSEKHFIEKEATIIGRNIYLPPPVIKSLIEHFGKKETIKYLQYAYYLSEEYVINRINILNEDLEYMLFDTISFKDDISIECENMLLFLTTKTCKRFGGNYETVKPIIPNNDYLPRKTMKDVLKLLTKKRKELKNLVY